MTTITSIVLREEVFELFNFLDQEEVHFMNSSFEYRLSMEGLFSTGVVLRYDGATTVQSNHRWLFTPAVQARWNIKNSFIRECFMVIQVGFIWFMGPYRALSSIRSLWYGAAIYV